MGATMALTAAAQDLRTSYFMETSVNRHEMNPALLSESYVNIPLVLGNFNLGTTSELPRTSDSKPSSTKCNLPGRATA